MNIAPDRFRERGDGLRVVVLVGEKMAEHRPRLRAKGLLHKECAQARDGLGARERGEVTTPGGRYLRALGRFAEWWQPPGGGAVEGDDPLSFALESALGKLESAERALIEGRYFTSESLEAIAVRHGLTVRAVEGRLARLRTRLRELIAKELQSARP